jgi:hypothetical protein
MPRMNADGKFEISKGVTLRIHYHYVYFRVPASKLASNGHG